MTTTLEFYTSQKYTDTIANPASATTILRVAPTGAVVSTNNRWNNADTLSCENAALLDFSARTCGIVTNSHFVFISPPLVSSSNLYTDTSTKLIAHESSKEVTIKFFVKFLGFTQLGTGEQTTYTGISTDEYDFYRYGTNMRLTLLKVTTTRIDLYVRNSSNALVAKFENFQTQIGKWTHISLSYSSYYDASDTTIYNYYPDKLNIQVGYNQLTVTAGTFDRLSITNFLTLTIAKEVIGLWTQGMVSYNYFTGFMGVYASYGDTTLTYANVKKTSTTDKEGIYKGTTVIDCLDTTNFFNSAFTSSIKYNCVRDYDFQIYQTTATYNCSYKPLGETACSTTTNAACPVGYIENTDNVCSCTNRDRKLMLINKNSGKNKCQSN